MDTYAPTIYILSQAMTKLKMFIDIAPKEISGYGVVEQEAEDVFTIVDAFIVKQESSSAETDIDGVALAMALAELDEKGIPIEKVRLWWHSHANMGTFFSNTDDKTMNETFADVPWWISVVGNKKNEFNVRFDQHKPVRFYADKQQLWVYDEHPQRLCEADGCYTLLPRGEKTFPKYCGVHDAIYSDLEDVVKELVSEPTYSYSKNYGEHGAYSRGSYQTYSRGRSGRAQYYDSKNGLWRYKDNDSIVPEEDGGTKLGKAQETGKGEKSTEKDEGTGEGNKGYSEIQKKEEEIFTELDAWYHGVNGAWCAAPGCDTRIPYDRDYCLRHDLLSQPGKTPENVEEYLKQFGVDEQELEYCDAYGCFEVEKILDSYYKGLVLCDEHMTDLSDIEDESPFMAGTPSTMILETLNEYLRNKNVFVVPNEEEKTDSSQEGK